MHLGSVGSKADDVVWQAVKVVGWQGASRDNGIDEGRGAVCSLTEGDL